MDPSTPITPICDWFPLPKGAGRFVLVALLAATLLTVAGWSLEVGPSPSSRDWAGSATVAEPAPTLPHEWVGEKRAIDFDHMFRDVRTERSVLVR